MRKAILIVVVVALVCAIAAFVVQELRGGWLASGSGGRGDGGVGPGSAGPGRDFGGAGATPSAAAREELPEFHPVSEDQLELIRHLLRASGEEASEVPPRNLQRMLAPLAEPTVLVQSAEEDTTSSFFGGMPPEYPGFEWPRRAGRPLGFLACFDLAATGHSFDWLPRSGWLLFFVDREEGLLPWGDEPGDRGAWAVQFVADPPAVIHRAEPPPGLEEDWVVEPAPVRFRAASLPPDSLHPEVRALGMTWEEYFIYNTHYRPQLYDKRPYHQIGGHQSPVQHSLGGLSAHLVASGIGHGKFYELEKAGDPRAAELSAAGEDWHLLFQMDSDRDLDVMWGDLGRLYFWVEGSDSRRGDFSRVWMNRDSG